MKILQDEVKDFVLEPSSKSLSFDPNFIQIFFIAMAERMVYFPPELVQKNKSSPILRNNKFSDLFDEQIFCWLTTEWV